MKRCSRITPKPSASSSARRSPRARMTNAGGACSTGPEVRGFRGSFRVVQAPPAFEEQSRALSAAQTSWHRNHAHRWKHPRVAHWSIELLLALLLPRQRSQHHVRLDRADACGELLLLGEDLAVDGTDRAVVGAVD